MATDWIKEVENRYLKPTLPQIAPGDTVKVKIKIKEGNKERLQAYEGVIIKMRGSGVNKTITVRRVFQGIGVERVFLLHSPKVDSIQIIRKGDVRRAKLYYLRELTGKAARIKEKVGALAAIEAEAKKAAKEAAKEAALKAEADAKAAAEAEAKAAAEAAKAEAEAAQAAEASATPTEEAPAAPAETETPES